MIMGTAIRLMAERGYGEMSVIDILAETGLSTRSFYRHFDSKDALLLALVRREAESVARSMARAIAEAAGPVEAVEAWLERLLDTFFVARQAARSALFTTPAAMASPAMSEGLAEIYWVLSRPVAEVLRAGHEAGVLVSPNPEADALSIFAVVGATAHAPHAKLGDRGAVKAQVVRFAWPALGLAGADPAGEPAAGRPRNGRG
jgi:AcrR family transcriptional regulator